MAQFGLVAAISPFGALFTPAPGVPAGQFSFVPAAEVPDMPAAPPAAFPPVVLPVVVPSIFIAGAVEPGVWVGTVPPDPACASVLDDLEVCA